MVSEARLREDLSILATRSQCVRAYSVIQGLDKVPEVAKSLGMKVTLPRGGDAASDLGGDSSTACPLIGHRSWLWPRAGRAHAVCCP